MAFREVLREAGVELGRDPSDWSPPEVALHRLRRAAHRLATELGASEVDAALRARRLFARIAPFEPLRPIEAYGLGEEEHREPEPAPKEDTTWITVELVDDDGDPVPFVRYRVELPDYQVREGRLDENGRAHLVGVVPGSCKVTFPDLDARDWRPI